MNAWIAPLATVLAAAIAAFVGPALIQRWRAKHDAPREDAQEKREEESLLITTLRNTAIDAVERARQGYEWAAAANARADAAIARADALSEQMHTLTTENEVAQEKIEELERTVAAHQRELVSLRSHNTLLMQHVGELEAASGHPAPLGEPLNGGA